LASESRRDNPDMAFPGTKSTILSRKSCIPTTTSSVPSSSRIPLVGSSSLDLDAKFGHPFLFLRNALRGQLMAESTRPSLPRRDRENSAITGTFRSHAVLHRR